MKSTAELADAAIARSMRLHLSREVALKQILRRIPLERLHWMSRSLAKRKRVTLMKCILHLIPYREPSKINANFTGKIRNPKKRLERMKKLFEGNGKPDPLALLNGKPTFH